VHSQYSYQFYEYVKICYVSIERDDTMIHLYAYLATEPLHLAVVVFSFVAELLLYFVCSPSLTLPIVQYISSLLQFCGDACVDGFLQNRSTDDEGGDDGLICIHPPSCHLKNQLTSSLAVLLMI